MLDVTEQAAATNEMTLAQNAEAIRELGKRTIADVIEIGKRLIQSKKLCGHGNWLTWLDREFGWSEDAAEKFMRVAKSPFSIPARNFELPLDGLYLLTASTTPEEVRTEILDRAEAGEKITVKSVRKARARATGNDQFAEQRAKRRMVTAGIMEMLDLFERDDVDPAERAAFIIEHFDRDMAGKLSLKRLQRSFDALRIVFQKIAADVYETGHAERQAILQALKTGGRAERQAALRKALKTQGQR
jgi:hypothetical protein